MMQQVGASARERLIGAAAARWNVPTAECSAAASVVTHQPSGRTLRYGELAADAAKVTLDKEPAIKTPAQFTFIPRPMPRVDVVHKTDGSAKFGIDAQVPGMVFAAITACPVPGGKLKSVDDSVLSGAPASSRWSSSTMQWRWSQPTPIGAPSGHCPGCSPSGMSAPQAASTASSFRRNTARRSMSRC